MALLTRARLLYTSAKDKKTLLHCSSKIRLNGQDFEHFIHLSVYVELNAELMDTGNMDAWKHGFATVLMNSKHE